LLYTFDAPFDAIEDLMSFDSAPITLCFWKGSEANPSDVALSILKSNIAVRHTLTEAL
jgi:hypothetical protein